MCKTNAIANSLAVRDVESITTLYFVATSLNEDKPPNPL